MATGQSHHEAKQSGDGGGSLSLMRTVAEPATGMVAIGAKDAVAFRPAVLLQPVVIVAATVVAYLSAVLISFAVDVVKFQEFNPGFAAAGTTTAAVDVERFDLPGTQAAPGFVAMPGTRLLACYSWLVAESALAMIHPGTLPILFLLAMVFALFQAGRSRSFALSAQAISNTRGGHILSVLDFAGFASRPRLLFSPNANPSSKLGSIFDKLAFRASLRPWRQLQECTPFASSNVRNSWSFHAPILLNRGA